MRIASPPADWDPAEAVGAALRESDQRYRELAEHCRDVCWIADVPSGRLCYLNPAFQSVFGLEPDLAYDDPDGWRYVIHHADRARLEDLWSQIDAGFSGWNIEYRICRPNGSIGWIQERAFPIRDLSGRALRIAGISEDSTERRQAHEQLRQYQTQLQRLTAELDDACESERRRVAEGLHDGVGQNLALARIQLGKLSQNVPDDCRELIQTTTDLMQRTIESTREMVFDLSPPPLYELGLWPALDWLRDRVKLEAGLDVHLEDRSPECVISSNQQVVLFRVVRELLYNVIKHSNSDRAIVRRFVADQNVFIQVEDSGRGFDVSQSANEAGLGLLLTRERMRSLQGTLEVESQPGDGTAVTLTIPVE